MHAAESEMHLAIVALELARGADELLYPAREWARYRLSTEAFSRAATASDLARILAERLQNRLLPALTEDELDALLT